MSSLLNEECQPLLSCLAEDKNGMTRAILEVVAGGIVQSAIDVERYVKCTLLNSTQSFQEVVKSAQDSLRWLCHRKFLEWDQNSEVYNNTPLGKAAFGSCLSPEESLVWVFFFLFKLFSNMFNVQTKRSHRLYSKLLVIEEKIDRNREENMRVRNL